MNIGNDAVELYVSKVKPLVYQRIFRSVMAYIGGSGESYQSITQRVNTIADSKTRFALMAVLAKNASIISEAEANQAINAAPSRQMMHVLRAILAGGGAATAAVLPASGLVAKWSVDDLTPVADGTAVSAWNDSVGGLPAVQATGGKQPLYKTNRLNGKPSLLFSGGQLMTAGTPAAIVTPMTNKVITIMVIFKGVTATTYGALYSGSTALSGSWLLYADATRVGRYNGSNLSTAALHSGSGFTSIAFTMEDTTAFSSGTRQERLYINGGCVGASPAVPDGTNDSIGFGGRAADSGLNLKGEVFDYLFWNRALTPAEVATAHAWACEKYGQAKPWDAVSKFYAFHGDSETQGTGTNAPEDTYPYKTAASLGLTYGQWTNLGVGGITINNMTAKAPTQVDPLAAATGKTLVVPCFEYYNSAAAHPTPANDMIAYLQARRTAGCKIVFATSMDSFLLNETDRSAYNSYWASNYATYTDSYAAIHTNANIGVDGSCGASQPSTYFADTIGHPTAAGYTVLAGLMTTAIQALP